TRAAYNTPGADDGKQGDDGNQVGNEKSLFRRRHHHTIPFAILIIFAQRHCHHEQAPARSRMAKAARRAKLPSSRAYFPPPTGAVCVLPPRLLQSRVAGWSSWSPKTAPSAG